MSERTSTASGGDRRSAQASMKDDLARAEDSFQHSLDREWKTSMGQALEKFRHDIDASFPKIDLSGDDKLSKEELPCARVDPSFDKATTNVAQWLGWEVDNSIGHTTNFDLIKDLSKDRDGWFLSEETITRKDLACLNQIIQTTIKTPDLGKKRELDENVSLLANFLKEKFNIFSDNADVLSIDKLSRSAKDENRSPNQLKEINFLLNNKKLIQDGCRNFPISDNGVITRWGLEKYLRTMKQEKQFEEVAIRLNSMLNRKGRSEYCSPDTGDTLNVFQTVVQEGKSLL